MSWQDSVGVGFRSGRFGVVGDWGEWKAAAEEFYWDRLEPAYQLASGLGASAGGRYETLYRWIEGEALTRRRSTQRKPIDWLTLETIDAECHGADHLARVVQAACEEVAHRFRFVDRPNTMVSVLAIETDAPWAVGRFGYMVDKYPFDKICIPNNRVHHETALHEVVAHEYAHVVVLNVTQGRAPRWLDEGIAMLAERSSDLATRRDFASGEAPWLSAHDLEITHSRNRQGEPERQRTWRAYQQSAWLVRYLVSIEGEGKMGDLLHAFGDNSAWTELRLRATGQSHADEALREVFNFGERDLFDRTLAWLKV